MKYATYGNWLPPEAEYNVDSGQHVLTGKKQVWNDWT